MLNPNSPMSNGEGYPDPTAYEAIEKTEPTNNSEEYDRFHRCLNLIYSICHLCGFKLEEHVVLTDKKTGRIWR